MSTFGDRTPHEEVLNAIEYIQDEFELTDKELVIVLLTVLRYKNDPYNEENEKLRRRKIKEE